MDNQLTFSAEKVRLFYDSLSEAERESLDIALDYIKSVPFEHGGIITRRLMSPVMVYTYDDGRWRIMYTLDTQRQPVFNIRIFGISPSDNNG